MLRKFSILFIGLVLWSYSSSTMAMNNRDLVDHEAAEQRREACREVATIIQPRQEPKERAETRRLRENQPTATTSAATSASSGGDAAMGIEGLRDITDQELQDISDGKYVVGQSVSKFVNFLRENKVFREATADALKVYLYGKDEQEALVMCERSLTIFKAFLGLLDMEGREALDYLNYYKAVYEGKNEEELEKLRKSFSESLNVEIPTHWTRQFRGDEKQVQNLLELLKTLGIATVREGAKFETTGYHHVTSPGTDIKKEEVQQQLTPSSNRHNAVSNSNSRVAKKLDFQQEKHDC